MLELDLQNPGPRLLLSGLTARLRPPLTTPSKCGVLLALQTSHTEDFVYLLFPKLKISRETDLALMNDAY